MKKRYCQPEIRLIEPMGGLLLGNTDSVGDPDGTGFNARRGSVFEDESEDEGLFSGKSIWDD